MQTRFRSGSTNGSTAKRLKGRSSRKEQLRWLEMIRDHYAGSLRIERDDFEEVPFAQHGGLGKVYQLFGEELWLLIDELNEVLAA